MALKPERNHMRIIAVLILAACGVMAAVMLAPHAPNDQWILTEYSDESGQQGMFYSLYNEKADSLILIDGGWTSNANKVRRVIFDHGAHVKAWILTHYHEDHCGAFNALWNSCRDRIDRVYVTPLDPEAFAETAKSYDFPETFAKFREQTKDAEQIVPLHRDDRFEIDELTCRVFNAYDEEVRTRAKDLANNCSLVFSVTAKKDSFLFLADMTDAGLGQYLLERYGSEVLHADRVQAAHHGNWGQPAEFYEAIRPKELYFDAPEWLMKKKTEKRFDARLLKEWCEQNGVAVHDFTGTPAEIVLE